MRFLKSYLDVKRKNRKEQIESTLKLLDEVKYCINNISTPGHSYNDYMLQSETEKVNERIMLISFIAMAIPCVYALSSELVSLSVKLLSALGILGIPLIYYSINKISKKIAMRRNIKSENIRQFSIAENELKELKQHLNENLSKEKIKKTYKNKFYRAKKSIN